MRDDIMLCQITSQRIPKDEYSISIKSDDTHEGSLQVDSFVRANMVFTASSIQIVKRVCSLSNGKYQEVCSMINHIINKKW